MTTIDETQSAESDGAIPPPPAPVRWWYLSLLQAVLVTAWSVFFYWLNRLPLQATDFWGHVAYGRWIHAQRVLPDADPFAPLLAANPLLDGAWLSQVVFAQAAARGGDEALSLLFATVVLASCLILARVFYLSSRSLFVAHLGVAVVCLLGWDRIATARPELFGMLCFSVLLWLLTGDRDEGQAQTPGDAATPRIRWEQWVGIPVLMMLWANLHESFVCGLFILACWFGGRLIDVACRGCSLRAILFDRMLRRRLWLLELGLVATCLNPYGVRLLLYVFWFADPAQRQQLIDWEPIELWGAGGRELLISLLVALFVFRRSRRRIPAADGLLLVVFSFALSGGLRMAWWYAAVFAVVVTPHVADLWQQWSAKLTGWMQTRSVPVPSFPGLSRLGLPAGRTWSYSAVALLLVWILFAVSPAGSTFVNGSPRPPEQLYGATTPWRLTQYLNEDPPQGPVFNPDEWGDWLTWKGPPGMWVFMTANMHLASSDVWIDYRIVRENRTGWSNVLDRYGVRTMVVDNRRQRTMRGYLAESPDWKIVYEDEAGTVFRRMERRPGRRNGG